MSASQRWVLESAGLVKEAVLQQSALDPVDSYCSPRKQFRLLDLVIRYHLGGVELIGLGAPVEQLTDLPHAAELARLKANADNDDLAPIDSATQAIEASFDRLRVEYGGGRGAAS